MWGRPHKPLAKQGLELGLAVIPTDVVDQKRQRGAASERGVGSSVIVEVDPARQRRQALVVGSVPSRIGPLVEQGLDEALGLAVGLRAVGTGAAVARAEALTRAVGLHGPAGNEGEGDEDDRSSQRGGSIAQRGTPQIVESGGCGGAITPRP